MQRRQETLIILMVLLISGLVACGSLRTTRFVPSLDKGRVLPQSGAVALIKNGIVAVTAPLEDVQHLTVFTLILMNETEQWVSFEEMECVLLDQSGKTYKPLDEKDQKLYLPKGYKPKPPQPLGAELFRWRQDRQILPGQRILPREDIRRTAIMPGRQAQAYLYFKLPVDRLSTVRLIVPHVRNEVSQEETSFVFTFEVVRG